MDIRGLNTRRLVTAAIVVVALGAVTGWWWTRPGGLIAPTVGRLVYALNASGQQMSRDRLAWIVEHAPWHDDARWQLIVADGSAGRLDAMFLHLIAYTELHPDRARGWVALARAFSAAGMSAEAERMAARALEADPENRDALMLRASARLEIGRVSGARVDLEQLGRGPGETQELQTLLVQAAAVAEEAQLGRVAESPRGTGQFWPGGLAAAVGNVLEAVRVEDWQRATLAADAADAAYPAAMFGPWLHGVVAYQRQQWQDAETHLLRGLQRAPRSERVLSMLLQVWARWHGAIGAGGSMLERAQTDPGFAVAWEMAAFAFMQARQPSRAEAALRAGAADPAAGPAPHRYLVQLQLDLDDPAAAIAAARVGAATYTDDRELSRLHAESAMRIGSGEAARQLLDEHLQRWVDDRAARALRIQHLVASKAEPADLRGDVEWLSRDAPDQPETLTALALGLLAVDEPLRALAASTAAVRLAPDNARALVALARARRATGDTDGALRAVEQALKLNRAFDERLDAIRLRRELAEG